MKPGMDMLLEDWGPVRIHEKTLCRRHLQMPSDKTREAGKGKNYYPNSTCRRLRFVSQEYGLYHLAWCTEETGLFDLKVRQHLKDPVKGT